jgi:preprotein translocase subunit SecG
LRFFGVLNMQIWTTLILAAQLIAALVMIGLVLIQHGKGADMGASFGSGASGSLFGATGSANFLSRATAACATVFFLCTLALAYLSSNSVVRRDSGGSVLDRPAVAASAPASGTIPGAAPAASAVLPAVLPAAVPAAAPAAAAASAPVSAAPAASAANAATAAAGVPAPATAASR